jgi:hypothetical protein
MSDSFTPSVFNDDKKNFNPCKTNKKMGINDCQTDFIEIKPDLFINKNQLIWMQKMGDCMFFSQRDKIHEVCNHGKKEDSLFFKLDRELFPKKS